MTRFNISLDEGVELVSASFERMWGGEIFVPKIPSYLILDVAKATAPDASIEIVGIRPGEKPHEEMITVDDALMTIEFEDYFVISPSFRQWDPEEFRLTSSSGPGKRSEMGFGHGSGLNRHFLTVDELAALIEQET
jgi:UDP-N-acetylglucosamine 4,6-dehydratase